MQTQNYPTYEDMSAAAADRIIELVRAKPEAVIGLATGSTPEGTYEAIIARMKDEKSRGLPDAVDFSKVTFFALDEYCGVPPEHPQSYHYYLWNKLLGPIGADPARVHIPDGMKKDFIEASFEYEAELDKAGKVDVWICGLGKNGHVAFNEPGSPFNGVTRKVPLSSETIEANSRFFAPGEPQPHHALTVGFQTLKDHASEILLLVNGEGKADILKQVLEGTLSARTPASVLRTFPNVTGYFDEAAASKLNRTPGQGIG